MFNWLKFVNVCVTLLEESADGSVFGNWLGLGVNSAVVTMIGFAVIVMGVVEAWVGVSEELGAISIGVFVEGVVRMVWVELFVVLVVSHPVERGVRIPFTD